MIEEVFPKTTVTTQPQLKGTYQMPTAQDVANAAMDKRDSMVHVTNEIFLIIQNDPKLMHMYLDAIAAATDIADANQARQNVNMAIGLAVFNEYDMDHATNERGDNLRNSDNVCTLIESYPLYESKIAGEAS